jgi:very-short-patch-repair endonuclease
MPFKDRMKPAPSEAALWHLLKGHQLGVPFLSQECILGYIVDFYCPPAKLVVEIDGGVHRTAEQRARDSTKDRALRRHGLVILRLSSELSAPDALSRIDRKLHFLQVGRKNRISETDRQKKNLAA